MATRPKFAKMANYSCECVECESHFPKMTFGECRRVWRVRHGMYKKKIFLGIKRSSLPLPNLPNSPNSLNSLNTCQICRRESQNFGGSLVFENLSTRQKRRIFGKYSNSLNSPASGHCLEISHLEILMLKVTQFDLNPL